METREVIVANTKTQKKYKITTDATTLGELQQALTANGIDYSGMSFTEGISRVKLLDPQSTLPQNHMYRGKLTNNLVILLTNTADKVASGAAVSRQEAYAYIKANSLQEAIKEACGRNFTQVPTTVLAEFIETHKYGPEEEEAEETEHGAADEGQTKEEAPAENTPETEEEEVGEIEAGEAAVGILAEHISLLYATEVLELEDLKKLFGILQDFILHAEREESEETGTPKKVEFSDGSLTDEDINDIIKETI